jgi:hypothetical protein
MTGHLADAVRLLMGGGADDARVSLAAGIVRARLATQPPPPRPTPTTADPALAVTRPGPCVFLGLAVPGEDGSPSMRDCPTCRGNVRLKVFACLHPAHEEHPETTVRDCWGCGDYEAGGAGRGVVGTAGMNQGINYWRGGS